MRILTSILFIVMSSTTALAGTTFTTISNICEKSETYDECVECCANSTELIFEKPVDVHCVDNPSYAIQFGRESNAFFVANEWFDIKTKGSICGKTFRFERTASSVDDCMKGCEDKK